MNNLNKNSKFEILNSRQIQINQAQNPKRFYYGSHPRFEHLNLGFRDCLVFRILRLGFTQKGGDLKRR
jgi:hypothetical protein